MRRDARAAPDAHQPGDSRWKLLPAAALALFTAAPALAASSFLVDFERSWDYTNGDVNGYYAGGTAADVAARLRPRRVVCERVGALERRKLDLRGTPSMLGTTYAHTSAPEDRAFMNVSAGVDNALSFFYSTPLSVVGAVRAYSGLSNGRPPSAASTWPTPARRLRPVDAGELRIRRHRPLVRLHGRRQRGGPQQHLRHRAGARAQHRAADRSPAGRPCCAGRPAGAADRIALSIVRGRGSPLGSPLERQRPKGRVKARSSGPRLPARLPDRGSR